MFDKWENVRNKVSQPCIIPILIIICFVNVFFVNNVIKCECTCLVGMLMCHSTCMCRHLELCKEIITEMVMTDSYDT